VSELTKNKGRYKLDDFDGPTGSIKWFHPDEFAGELASAEKNLAKAKKRKEGLQSDRKWFGGGKESKGFQSGGATNKGLDEAQKDVDSSNAALSKIKDFHKRANAKIAAFEKGSTPLAGAVESLKAKHGLSTPKR
jgi:hypothetical protein